MSADPTELRRRIFEHWFASIEERDASFVDRTMHDEFRLLHAELHAASSRVEWAVLLRRT